MSHPQHPSCECGKALFKSPVAAKVKPSDPYAYCRNPACAQYTFRDLLGKTGFDPKNTKAVTLEQLKASKPIAGAPKPSKRRQVGPGPAPTSVLVTKPRASKAPEEKPVPTPKPTSKRGRKRAAMPISEAPPKKPAEPDPIAKARVRIKELLGEVAGDAPRSAIGLVLAIVSQETGNQKAAEALIDEFKLDATFGLQKFPQSV
jgi:hypothetical protein